MAVVVGTIGQTGDETSRFERLHNRLVLLDSIKQHEEWLSLLSLCLFVNAPRRVGAFLFVLASEDDLAG